MENSVFDLQTYDVTKNYCIEASAGTGKTYNIVKIAKKIIKSPDTKVKDLDEILIVTYTEKATNELRQRIREELPECNVDNAPIFTIHSFCKTILDEFAISANSSLNLTMASDADLLFLSKQYLRSGDILRDIFRAKQKDLQINEDSIIESFKKAIAKYHLDSNYNEEPDIISFVNSKEMVYDWIYMDSFDVFYEKYSDFAAIYDYVVSHKDSKVSGVAAQIRESFGNILSYNGKDIPVSKKLSDDEKTKRKWLSDFKGQFKDLNIGKVLVAHYLKDFYIKWQEYKHKYTLQTFDDMIRTTREALMSKDKTFLNKVKNKYKYAIIDEFQDTNQKAFDIFKMIFMDKEDDKKIIVVGDPKQSIYSFQGADVEVYKKAYDYILENEGISSRLDTCYRATKPIVEACNALFKSFKNLNFQESKYLTLAANEKEIIAKQNGFDVEIGFITSKNAAEPRHFAKFAVEQIIKNCSFVDDKHTYLQIGEKTKTGEKLRNTSFKDVTILVKSRSESVYIEKELKKVGIPYIKYKDTNLFLGRECAHWISLLEAIMVEDFTGYNRKYLKRALFTEFFGYSLKEIADKVFEKDEISEVALINKWKLLVLENSWEELIYSILFDTNMISRLSELNSIQSLSQFKQIGTFCLDYLIKTNNILDLIEELKSLSKGSNDEDDESGSIVKKATDFNCVKIMTIHASKGLTLPVVVSVAGIKNIPNSSACYTYHDDDGKPILSFNKDPKVTDETKNEWERCHYVAYTRPQYLMIFPTYGEHGESSSGITDKISSFVADNEKLCSDLDFDNEPYDVLKEKVKEILEKTSSGNKPVDRLTKDEQKANLNSLVDTKFSRAAFRHSYSSISHNKKMEVVNFDGESEIIDREGKIDQTINLTGLDTNGVQVDAYYDSNLVDQQFTDNYPKGKYFGNALHEIFEVIDYTQTNLDLHRPIIKEKFESYGLKVNDEIYASTLELIDRVLGAKIPLLNSKNAAEHQYFYLKDLKNKDKLPELVFDLRMDNLNKNLNNFLNGSIDLLFKMDDKFYILDWKTDRLNDEGFDSYSKKESLKSRVDRCYSVQRVLYAYCLIQWLRAVDSTLSEEELFNKYFGGVYYVFVRGCNKESTNGIYCQTWNSWNDLKESFDLINLKLKGGSK